MWPYLLTVYGLVMIEGWPGMGDGWEKRKASDFGWSEVAWYD